MRRPYRCVALETAGATKYDPNRPRPRSRPRGANTNIAVHVILDVANDVGATHASPLMRRLGNNGDQAPPTFQIPKTKRPDRYARARELLFRNCSPRPEPLGPFRAMFELAEE